MHTIDNKYNQPVPVENEPKIITGIDFSINGLSTENHLQSQQTPTPYKIKVYYCTLIDLVIIIELTLSYTVISAIASFTAVAENGQCKYNGIWEQLPYTIID